MQNWACNVSLTYSMHILRSFWILLVIEFFESLICNLGLKLWTYVSYKYTCMIECLVIVLRKYLYTNFFIQGFATSSITSFQDPCLFRKKLWKENG